MHGSAVVSALLAGVCGITGIWCLVRMRNGPPATRRTAEAEAVMGLGMAAMVLPEPFAAPPLAFAALFSAAALRSLWGTRHARAHGAHHALEALAMVYMALVMATTPGGAHPDHGTHPAVPGGVPVLTGALLGYFAGYALWTGARWLGPPGTSGPVLVSAAVPGACRVTLALSGFTMLLTL